MILNFVGMYGHEPLPQTVTDNVPGPVNAASGRTG
jgi:hypothetical protein